MNGKSKLRALAHLAVFALVGASASNASAAWRILYCDGFGNNNLVAITGAGCETPNSNDCWEDPSHNPPVYASGKTYTRGQARICNGTRQIRAYAFTNLKDKAKELGGDAYYARSIALNINGGSTSSTTGKSYGYIDDASADGAYSGWLTVGDPEAVVVRTLGYITHQ